MPYLHCPRCHRTAWVRSAGADAVDCRHCGRELELTPAGDVRYLTTAVRERFAREARLSANAKRFVRNKA